jgi:hypothetical protein
MQKKITISILHVPYVETSLQKRHNQISDHKQTFLYDIPNKDKYTEVPIQKTACYGKDNR